MGAGRSAVPAQVTWAGLWLPMHGCSTTSQSCHSAPPQRIAGARACVTFRAPLAFPKAQFRGSSGVGGGWTGDPAAPPQPSARHTASAAWRFQNASHTGCQDCPRRTSTVPLQRLLPFTRRTPSCSPGRTRHQLRPGQVRTRQMLGMGWARVAVRGPTNDLLVTLDNTLPDSGPQPFSLQSGAGLVHPPAPL